MSGKKFIIILLLFLFSGCSVNKFPKYFNTINKKPNIFPPSHGTVIPPNICPINFIIREKGSRFYVNFYSVNYRFNIYTRKNNIIIPNKKWIKLFKNGNKLIYIDIYTFYNNSWQKYETITDTISNEVIDPYIAYRKIPVCKDWTVMGFYQRNLENFKELSVFHNKGTDACINCHSYSNNSSSKMIFEIRSKTFGTPMIIKNIKDNKNYIDAINTKTQYTTGKAGYTALNPICDLIAFTTNKFEMLFHTSGIEPRFVYNGSGDIAFYDLKTNTITTTSSLSQKDFIETMPEWSKDGKYLYYSCCPQLKENQIKEIKCNLLRIEFNPKTKCFGNIDTIVKSEDIGGSILQPRISPDNRFIIVNIAPYSDFPVDKVGTRLAIINTQTKELKIINANTNFSDTWHCWSSNGRWIAFNSKRLNGRFSSIFLCYFDTNGIAHNPFVLPQKDPNYYEYSISAYNIPEFITSKISLSKNQLKNALNKYKKKPPVDITTSASPKKDLKDEF
jgi:hypothetical protein